MRARLMNSCLRTRLLRAVIVMASMALVVGIETSSGKAHGTSTTAVSSAEDIFYELVTSTMKLRADNPSIGQSEAFSNHYFTALRSAFIGLDRSKSTRALDITARLSAYEMGASVIPLYDCLVLRKGKAIKPFLKKVEKMGEKACSPQLVGTQCLDRETLRTRISSLIGDIDAGTRCDVPLIPNQ